jgi:stage V sporulation protein D (sporulation-specific penicillin-binding protein)
MCDRRLWFIFCFVIFLTGAIIWSLFRVQIIQGTEWKAQARGQQVFFEQTQGERGSIYLKGIESNLIPVAINKRVYHAYISPRELRAENKEELGLLFSEALSIEKKTILEKLEKDNSFEFLKKNITAEELEKVKEIKGLHLVAETVRNYPEKELASHVLGFVGGETIGQYGVEQYYEEIISGKTGVREGIKSGWGFFVVNDSTQRGEDIILTIDYNIQHFTEKALEEAVKRVSAKRGSVLVGDPKTGEVLALANYPRFDPNKYSEIAEKNFQTFKNPVIQENFEPGSVFKPVTMAIALDRGAVTPEDTYFDTGEFRVHGRVIRNYDRRNYGLVTMTKILERSINTGIVHVKDKIGNENFLKHLNSFGFFEKTGIDLHGEVHSPNRSFLEGHDVNFATASYGQGIEVTLVQLFKAFSILANGGVPIDPHIVKKEETTNSILPKERVISSTATFLVTEMMVSTINHGFGSTAKVPGYHVAGKTGTAQMTWSKLGLPGAGYSDRTIQGFVGYAPAFNPAFVILVKLDEPQTRSAEVSAAPVFKEIAEYILDYKKIPYDYDVLDE